MLPKFMPSFVAVLAAGTCALLGLPSAVAESAAPGTETASPPEKGTANARRLTWGEVDALMKRLEEYWNPPAGVKDPEEIIVRVRISLKPDGTLADGPRVMTVGTTENYLKARNAAVVAIYRAQPFTMLLPVNYKLWKELEITFDPRGMGKR